MKKQQRTNNIASFNRCSQSKINRAEMATFPAKGESMKVEFRSIWIGTQEEWNECSKIDMVFHYDVYIVLDKNGKRILKKCRF